MKRLYVVLAATLAVASLGLAVAQGVGDLTPLLSGFDPRALGQSPFTLGAWLFLVLAILKRADDRRKAAQVPGAPVPTWASFNSRPWFWAAVATALAGVMTWGLFLLGYGATLVGMAFPWGVLLFWAASALTAMGLRDAAKTAVEWLTRPRARAAEPVVNVSAGSGPVTITAPTVALDNGAKVPMSPEGQGEGVPLDEDGPRTGGGRL